MFVGGEEGRKEEKERRETEKGGGVESQRKGEEIDKDTERLRILGQ